MTLEELRESLRKGEEPVVARGLDVGKIRRKRVKGGFTLSMKGDDAVLHFGVHSGESVSDMVRDKEQRGYLHWILKCDDFANELKEAIRICLAR